MLTQLQIKNFKSYRQATLPLGRLTVLIGANASGKSNAIEALHVLSYLAQGKRLNFIGTLEQHDLTFRGNIQDLTYRGEFASFELSCVTTETEWNNLVINLGITPGGNLKVIQEKIYNSQSQASLYELTELSPELRGDVLVNYNSFTRGGKKPKIACSNQMAIFTQILSAFRFSSANQKSREIIPSIAERYVSWLGNIVFLEPDPRVMRHYGHKTDHILQRHGENLSGVIYNLCQDIRQRETILSIIKSLPEQNIEDLSFIETPREEVLLQLMESFGEIVNHYDVALLSDGTLRVLAISAALLSAAEESLVVIEEIDNGVHPSRASALLEQIMLIAEERNLRVLISSHNPALLDALPDAAVPDTVFCYRDPEDGSSRLVRLQDLPDYPELIAQGSIGHLMSRGLIERFVKHQSKPEQKQEKTLAWLAHLESWGV